MCLYFIYIYIFIYIYFVPSHFTEVSSGHGAAATTVRPDTGGRERRGSPLSPKSNLFGVLGFEELHALLHSQSLLQALLNIKRTNREKKKENSVRRGEQDGTWSRHRARCQSEGMLGHETHRRWIWMEVKLQHPDVKFLGRTNTRGSLE